MSYRTLLSVCAVLALLFGLGFLIAPASTLALYTREGYTASVPHAHSAQWFGMMLVSFAVLNWMARDVADAAARRAVIAANVVQAALGVGLSALGVLQGTVNSFTWSTTFIYATLLAAFLLVPRVRTAAA